MSVASVDHGPALPYDDQVRRFDLFGALYILCCRYHTGQASRGYRILSRLSRAGYSPGLTVQRHEFESEEQRDLYLTLAARYRHDL